MSKHVYGLRKDEIDNRDFLFKDLTVTKPLPSSVDLRNAKMPTVYNQLSEGSCTAQGGTCVREYMLNDKTKQLSRQFLYNVERILEGTPLSEDSGCQMRTIPKAIAKYGICEENYLPYSEDNLGATPSAEAYKNGLNYPIIAYHRLTTQTEMKQALAQDLIILAGISVYESFEENVKDNGKIPLHSKNESVLGGHCVTLVGFVDAKPVNKLKYLLNLITKKSTSKGYFILRNSWSDKSTSEGGWGDKGYGYLPYEEFDKIKNGDMWVITK